MKVLFIKDVPGTAYAGDVKIVKNGFGRNHLLPKNLAVLATADQLNRVGRLRTAAGKRRESEEKEMAGLFEKLEGTIITLEVRAGRNDRLYGAITNTAIAEEVSKVVGQEIDRRTISTEPLRQLGSYKIPVRLGHGIEPRVTVVVAPIGGVREQEATAEEVIASLEEAPASAPKTAPEAEASPEGTETSGSTSEPRTEAASDEASESEPGSADGETKESE